MLVCRKCALIQNSRPWPLSIHLLPSRYVGKNLSGNGGDNPPRGQISLVVSTGRILFVAVLIFVAGCLLRFRESRMAPGGFVKKIQTLSFLATLAIAIGMISWGSALHAQDTTPSTPDRQAQQPDTTPPPQTSPSTPDNQQYPTSQQQPSQQQPPDTQQPPDSTAPSGRTPQSGAQRPSDSAASGGTDSQTFSGTVVKQGDKYMLKDDSGHVYDIDHQDEVKKFDGKRVRVQGTLDPSGNKILVK